MYYMRKTMQFNMQPNVLWTSTFCLDLLVILKNIKRHLKPCFEIESPFTPSQSQQIPYWLSVRFRLKVPILITVWKNAWLPRISHTMHFQQAQTSSPCRKKIYAVALIFSGTESCYLYRTKNLSHRPVVPEIQTS